MYIRAWRSLRSAAPTFSAIRAYAQSTSGARCAVTRAAPEVNLPSRVPLTALCVSGWVFR
ncbi:hypothetical protein SCANM63S_09026 [Streptomyces canarius]